METQRYYVTKIVEHLSNKQRENAQYSLRALARDVDLHSSTLSQVIKGKRPLPLKKAKTVAEKLDLSPAERTLFMESFYRSKTKIDDIEIKDLDDRFIVDESNYRIISEWEHFAVLDLFDLSSFSVTRESISKKYSLTSERVEVVLNNLKVAGLLDELEGKLFKIHPDIKTTEDIQSKALKESHKETLNMGLNKLEEIEMELRDFSSSTMAIDLEKLSEAKTIIREFRQKMTSLLRDGHKTDVYQLAIQFFPLTEVKNEEKKQ